jgi:hypothetical protein
MPRAHIEAWRPLSDLGLRLSHRQFSSGPTFCVQVRQGPGSGAQLLHGASAEAYHLVSSSLRHLDNTLMFENLCAAAFLKHPSKQPLPGKNCTS